MAKYAVGTDVTVERSKAEIERILNKYGATDFGYMRSGETYMVVFQVAKRRVRFILPMPVRSEFTRTETGKVRVPNAVEAAWEQACRSRWRALVLMIKAKLEAVEAGIVSFEEEFLAHIMLPDGRTVGEWTQPQLEQVYASGQMPALMPGLPRGYELIEGGKEA